MRAILAMIHPDESTTWMQIITGHVDIERDEMGCIQEQPQTRLALASENWWTN